MPKTLACHRIVLLAALMLGSLATIAPAQRPGGEVTSGKQILFILDASGSMTAKLPGGGTRMEAAQSALVDMVQKLPASTNVALRVYGHTSTPDKKNCDDTALVMGFGPASAQKDAIKSKVMGLKALGYTPISRTLEKAARDFDGQPKGPRTVILVSDGRETCKADPCAVASALAKADADLVVHTIGFGVDDAARRQLQCVSRVARGTYFDAETRGQLSKRLAEVAALPPRPVTAEPPPRPTPTPKVAPTIEAPTGTLKVAGLDQAMPTTLTDSSTGKQLLFTPHSDTISVPPGLYTLTLANGTWPSIEVRAGETTEIAPAFLRIARPAGVLALIDPETGEAVAEYHGGSSPLTAMGPGRYRVRTLEGFEWPERIELKWGQTLVLKSSILRMRAEQIPAGGIIEAVVRRAGGGHTATAVFDANNTDLGLPAGRYDVTFPGTPGRPPVVIDLNEDTIHEVAAPPIPR